MLRGARGSVLDVPVGTGRFLPLYDELKLIASGIDSSEEMLALASKKKSKARLSVGDASKLTCKDKFFDHAVCVRFLDLIDEDAMVKVTKELFRVTRKQIVLTIRLGEKYVPKSNTAEHDEKKFRALIKRSGWMVAQDVPIFNAGWHVMKLMPR